MPAEVTNVKLAGLGGQGVLKASDILAQVAFRAGQDVKKSELHGMSQRGGSVASDVRFGARVWSPMVPPGETDFLVVLSADQVAAVQPELRPGGVLIPPSVVAESDLPHKRSLNVALLGVLSRHLAFPEELWRAVIADSFPEILREANLRAFALGRQA